MTTPRRLQRLRRLVPAAGAALLLAALLALDLANRGLAWQMFWSLTGEETPAAQFRGMIEWAGSLTRPQPRLQPFVPIAHRSDRPYGINTFLEQEVELAKREQQVRMIAGAGFTWMRQEFPWQDIEIHGRGDFTDRRNDLDGDGQPDSIDAWAKYDHIVGLAEQYGLRLQVRLSNPPAWAQADSNSGDFAPPTDFDDFVNYAVAVAQRYRGRIHHYQVWNEPNIYPEWGEASVDPEAFTDLLCRTYDALKQVDPDIVVINGALAPTVSLDGRDLSDFVYLQRMYNAGAGACFDIHSMQGYGLNSGPTDRRMRPTTVNFSRNLYIRDLMVANGDAHKPIWISEAAWSPVAEPGVPPDLIGFGNFGRTTLEQAARYMPLAYERAKREWPWVGVVNYWFFKRATDHEKNQAFYYFRMVEPDFTTLPVYDSMRAYLAQQTPTLYLGIHQADHWAITIDDTAESVTADGAQLATAIQTRRAQFTAHGTQIVLRWQGEAPLRVGIVAADNASEASLSLDPQTDGWQSDTLHSTLTAGPATFTLESDAPFLFDSVMVLDRTTEGLLPLMLGAAIAVGMLIGVIVSAVRARTAR